MDEKDLPPAPPLESTSSASSSSKENDGEEEKAKMAQAANASSSTEEEEGEVEKVTRSFPDLPSIVMEYILAHFSYYEVLQMRLISSSWNDLIKGYLNKADEVFQHNLARHNVQWLSVKEVIKDFKQPSEEVAPINRSSSSNLLKKPIVPKMSPRYHHCACYLNDSMYIFGGCIAPNTAYNDLWRFDMTSKHWTRIIAAGTPPLPRIFCSFTPYETADEATGKRRQYIVLFGGFLFDENLATRDRLLWNIHLYDIAENRWTQLPIGPLVEEEGSKSNQQNQNPNQNQQPPQSQQQQQLLLRSGNHSAVVIGDELIVFNGLRYVSTLGSGPASTLESEVPCNHVYAFHLREHCWRRVDGCPADQPGHHHRVSPRKSVRCPLHFDIRSTLEATQPMCTRRKAATQTPVALDAHHILYICGCSSNVLFIGAFLLTRERCHQSNCELCQKKEEEGEEESEGEEITTKEGGVEEQQLNKEAAVGGSKKQQREGKAQKKEEKDDDTRWKWAKVEISKEGLDFEFTHGVEFCKVGNMMAYLTAKDVAVPVRRHPPPPPPPPPAKPRPSPSSSSQPKKSLTPPSHPPRSQSAPSTPSSSSSSSSTESAARAASVATVFPSIPPLHHFRGPPQHVNSHASNRQLLRERRIESLDYYQRQFEQLHPPQQLNQQQQQQLQNQQMLVAQLEVVVRAVENGHYRDYLNRREEQENAAAAAARAAAPALPVPAVITRYSDSTTVHRSSLQLSLLDISRVITERRIERVRQRHEMDYSVVPEALAAYSLVAAPSGLLLFGGYVVNTNQPGQHSTPRDVYEAAVLNEGPAVSSKLFIIASKPEMRLY